ncbi:hypothetical protein TNCV_3416571 [Trichonephila clavipes]|nr:hypothetical protein TNCV_3416571 [Trichonephila clavipes]
MTPSQYGGYAPRLLTEWVWVGIPRKEIENKVFVEVVEKFLTRNAAEWEMDSKENSFWSLKKHKTMPSF